MSESLRRLPLRAPLVVTSMGGEPSQMEGALDEMSRLLVGSRRLVVLTGAGVSTESGIPDYRSPRPRQAPRPAPIQHLDFVRKPAVRARYWARSMVGWPRLRAARPNSGHQALAELEAAGRLRQLITQNVDGLHQLAGSHRVLELHGALRDVLCLDCGAVSSRQALQQRLLEANPEIAAGIEGPTRPDGDAAVSAEGLAQFVVPSCLRCGGVLKPAVVFFGGTVAPAVADASFRAIAEADALLVIGTSLAVWSSFRLVRAAARREIPVGLITRGETRGDPIVTLKLAAPLGEVLPPLVDRLLERSS